MEEKVTFGALDVPLLRWLQLSIHGKEHLNKAN